MALIEIDWNPKDRQLRNFGKVALAATAVISFLLYLLKGLAIQWALVIFGFGLLVFIVSLISLKLTKVIYLGMIMLTMPIGYVVSIVLMASFYFLLLTPIGLIFRLIGRDPLRRKFDPSADSYWLKRQPPRGNEQYFHQF
jgi:ABC-type uncharacterized transport system permease subunit